MSQPDLTLPEIGNPPHHYRVEIPRVGKKWITANQRTHWRATAPMVKQWREVAAWRARKVPTLQRAHVVVEVRFSDKRRRDPGNWAPTAKAVVDGLVDAGVFPDDNYQHVIGPDMRLGPHVTKAEEALIVHIFRVGSEQ